MYANTDAATRARVTASLLADADRQAEARQAVQARACCDGTGWTGNPRTPCADHYEPVGEFWLSLSHERY